MKLPRTLKTGLTGKDVHAHKRAVYRLLGEGRLARLQTKPSAVQERFQKEFATEVGRAQKALKVPVSGIIAQRTHDALWPYFDARAKALMVEYLDEQLPPPLIEPRQGFESLHPSLHELFSIGRSMGLSDLGTYNPGSKLPGSGAPSDHAVYPAFAFDLGIDPDTGYAHPVGRRFFDICRKDKRCEYVILGNRISNKKIEGGKVRPYTSGGHLNHVHCSGWR